ncbi:hypothetical protein RED65_05229 [Oceanobacter sp. RED65]|uniref:Lipoprotein n=2 Tax=Bermanella marisrubri TaxID=207949 RepID=Q1N0S1_9GAMM|nr:hypothetical protein RED65_05229 [Oceanobacter sp. RED65] [Bermanella marisrubri]
MKKRFLVFVMTFGLLGCESDLSALEDDELRKRINECDYAVSLTPAEHQVCRNYHRECKRRLDEEERFVCQ